MSMVCGLDLHRQQITFDALETESGEVRGRKRHAKTDRSDARMLRELLQSTNPRSLPADGITPGNARSGWVSRRGQRFPGTRPGDRRQRSPAWCPG
jgi:hypothetical protein